MRPTRHGFKKAALACGTAGLVLAATVPSALAAAGHSHYAGFTFAGESVTRERPTEPPILVRPGTPAVVPVCPGTCLSREAAASVALLSVGTVLIAATRTSRKAREAGNA